MKKFTSIFSFILMTVMAFSFTSCDDDVDIAQTLDGTWKGYLHTTLPYQGHDYVSSTAEVTFSAGLNAGSGYWLDQYSNAPWDYVANRISWNVTNRKIYITFHDTQEKAVIRNYHLDDDYFYGEIEFNSTNTWTEFQFVKTYSPRWDDYYWYGTDSWYHSWGYDGYAKASEPTDTPSVIVKEDDKASESVQKRFFPNQK